MFDTLTGFKMVYEKLHKGDESKLKYLFTDLSRDKLTLERILSYALEFRLRLEFYPFARRMWACVGVEGGVHYSANDIDIYQKEAQSRVINANDDVRKLVEDAMLKEMAGS